MNKRNIHVARSINRRIENVLRQMDTETDIEVLVQMHKDLKELVAELSQSCN